MGNQIFNSTSNWKMASGDKMHQDYIWTKHHQAWDADETYRNHGNHYIFYQAPNHSERIEMTYRSMGKSVDWDLEKFRMGRKYPDRGNKRRFTKNVVRFLKNPVGYTYWHNHVRIRAANPRMFHVFILLSATAIWTHYMGFANAKSMKAKWLTVSGANPEGNTTGGKDYGMHDNSSIAIPFMWFNNMGHVPLKAEDIIVSPSRNQGYRKYFETNQKYGLAIQKSGH